MKKSLMLSALFLLWTGLSNAGPVAVSTPSLKKVVKGSHVLPGKGKDSDMALTDSMMSKAQKLTKEDLDLQKKAEAENKKYKALSKSSKIRHDKVKNSVSNVR